MVDVNITVRTAVIIIMLNSVSESVVITTMCSVFSRVYRCNTVVLIKVSSNDVMVINIKIAFVASIVVSMMGHSRWMVMASNDLFINSIVFIALNLIFISI